MPPLSTYNCFEVLANISDSEMFPLDVQKLEEFPIPVLTPIPSPPKKRKLKWEKTLPEKFTIAITEGTPNSLNLKEEIETTNTAEKKSITALASSTPPSYHLILKAISMERTSLCHLLT